MGSLLRELGIIVKKPDARALILWMVGLLAVGTVFYHVVEGWNWLDSLLLSTCWPKRGKRFVHNVPTSAMDLLHHHRNRQPTVQQIWEQKPRRH